MQQGDNGKQAAIIQAAGGHASNAMHERDTQIEQHSDGVGAHKAAQGSVSVKKNVRQSGDEGGRGDMDVDRGGNGNKVFTDENDMQNDEFDAPDDTDMYDGIGPVDGTDACMPNRDDDAPNVPDGGRKVDVEKYTARSARKEPVHDSEQLGDVAKGKGAARGGRYASAKPANKTVVDAPSVGVVGAFQADDDETEGEADDNDDDHAFEEEQDGQDVAAAGGGGDRDEKEEDVLHEAKSLPLKRGRHAAAAADDDDGGDRDEEEEDVLHEAKSLPLKRGRRGAAAAAGGDGKEELPNTKSLRTTKSNSEKKQAAAKSHNNNDDDDDDMAGDDMVVTAGNDVSEKNAAGGSEASKGAVKARGGRASASRGNKAQDSDLGGDDDDSGGNHRLTLTKRGGGVKDRNAAVCGHEDEHEGDADKARDDQGMDDDANATTRGQQGGAAAAAGGKRGSKGKVSELGRVVGESADVVQPQATLRGRSSRAKTNDAKNAASKNVEDVVTRSAETSPVLVTRTLHTRQPLAEEITPALGLKRVNTKQSDGSSPVLATKSAHTRQSPEGSSPVLVTKAASTRNRKADICDQPNIDKDKDALVDDNNDTSARKRAGRALELTTDDSMQIDDVHTAGRTAGRLSNKRPSKSVPVPHDGDAMSKASERNGRLLAADLYEESVDFGAEGAVYGRYADHEHNNNSKNVVSNQNMDIDIDDASMGSSAVLQLKGRQRNSASAGRGAANRKNVAIAAQSNKDQVDDSVAGSAAKNVVNNKKNIEMMQNVAAGSELKENQRNGGVGGRRGKQTHREVENCDLENTPPLETGTWFVLCAVFVDFF
jgi:hypothetical protein